MIHKRVKSQLPFQTATINQKVFPTASRTRHQINSAQVGTVLMPYQRSSFKFLSILFITGLFIWMMPQAQAQECKECGYRSVYVYDLAIDTYNPVLIQSTKECLKDPGCVQAHQAEINIWKNLHQASVGLKSTLAVNPEGPQGCVTIYLDAPNADPWVKPHYHSSTVSTTQKMYIDDGVNITPVISTQPAQPAILDYLIYGKLSGRTAPYQLNMALMCPIRNEKLYSAMQTCAGEQDAYDAGRALIPGGTAKITEVILDYEKKKRDESNAAADGKIAREPKLAFSSDVYSFAEKNLVAYGNIDVTLIDCDGVPLTKKKITMTATDGKLTQSDFTTDDNGKVSVVYYCGQSKEAAVTAKWDFEYPSGRTNFVTKTVKVKKQTQVEHLDAQCTVKVIKKVYLADKNDPNYCSMKAK